MRSGLLGLAIAALLAGSAVAGHPLPDPSRFKVGEATPEEVIHVYGRPTTEERNSNGEQTLTYRRFSDHAKAASFVPIVGMFAGGVVAHASDRTFVFDKDGRLKSYSSSDSRIDCGAAISGANCTQ